MQFDDERRAAIREQVSRIAATEPFARAPKTNNLLAFIVDMTLEGRPEELNQRRIAEMVFGKRDFDPTIDGFVKERARDLRRKLETYYASEGRNDQWKIDIPNGGFVAKFTLQQPLEQAAGDHAPDGNILGRKLRSVVRRRWPVPVGVAAVVIFLVVEVFASPGHPVKIKNLVDGAKVHAQEGTGELGKGPEDPRKLGMITVTLEK